MTEKDATTVDQSPTRTPPSENVPTAFQPDFERFFNQSLDLMAIVDGDAVFRSVNPAWERTLGYGLHELVGLSFLDFLHRDDREATWSRAVETAEGDATIGFENRWRHKDGSWLRIRWTVVPDPERLCFYAVGRDLSEKDRYQALVAEQESRLSSILDAAVDAIILASEDGVIRSANASACRLFGYRLEELEGKNLSILMPEPHSHQHDEYLRRYIETGEGRILGTGRELIALRKDGREIPIFLSLSATRVDGSFFFAGIIRDLTEAKARETLALEEAGARRAAEIQVSLALELHDGLLQILAGSLLQLRTAERLLVSDPASAEARLGAIREAIAAEQKSIRMFVESNRDPELLVGEGIDLKDALDQLAERMESIWGIHLDVTTSAVEPPSASDRREILRLVQEAAVNAVRHGNATVLRVSVTVLGEQAHLQISDNGGGFEWEGRCDHETLREQRRGPLSLRRRIEALGGRLTITSDPNGVELEIDIPLTRAAS